MERHMQPYKPLKETNQESKEEEERTGKECHWAKLDTNSIAQRHRENYRIDKSQELLDSFPSSSSCSKKSNEVSSVKNKPEARVVQRSMLYSIFDALPSNLKKHCGYIFENKNGKTFCDVCNVDFDSVFHLPEHLKTKVHENNIILNMKKHLPDYLHHSLEFISFYDFNLCCNICRCNIDLSCSNVHATIVNIFAHNATEGHLNQKKINENCHSYDNCAVILKTLALINPVINDNKDYIDYKMHPQFKCNLCDKNIANHENEKKLLNNFISHFSSLNHKQTVEVILVLESFKEKCLTDEGKINFTLSNSKVFCTICNVSIEPAIDKLILHVRQCNCASLKMKQVDLMLLSSKLSLNAHKVENVRVNPSTSKEVKTDTVQTSSEVDDKKSFDQVYESLRKTDSLITNHSKLIKKHWDEVHYICTLCLTQIQPSLNIDNFKKQIYQHIKCNEHMEKLEVHKLLQIKTLHTESSYVKQWFEMLPRHHQANVHYIIEHNEESNVFICIICYEKIPQDPKYLQEHIEKTSHVGAFQMVCRLNKIKSQKVNLVGGLKKIAKSDNFLLKCTEFLINEDKNYKCLLCNSIINISADEELFKENIKSHFVGNSHLKTYLNIPDGIFEWLSFSHPVVRTNIDYLERKGEHFFCIHCQCTISGSENESALKENLVSHLTGNKHTKKREQLQMALRSRKDFQQ